MFRHDYSSVQSQFENQLKNLQNIYHSWSVRSRDGSLSYRHFPSQIIQNFYGFQFQQKSYLSEVKTPYPWR